MQLLPDNPDLKWIIPTTGGMIWTDNMLIPKGGDAYTASVYMNYAYIPAVAAKIAAYIQYVTPVKGTQEAMSKVDPSLAVGDTVAGVAGIRPKGQLQLRNAAASRLRAELSQQETREPCHRADDCQCSSEKRNG